MLERTTRSYFEDVITKDFKYLQSNTGENRKNPKRNKKLNSKTDDLIDEQIMTRKTRTRRPRISALQSGYCAVCNIPYNSVEDHIQSKKHQKLIGEDANYIALNGSINGFLQTSTIPFLSLNGIDAIGVHETSLDELSAIHRTRSMRRSRAASVLYDRVNPSPLSPTGSDTTGHHLRSRRNINYMTPPLDDDSLQETPDLTVQDEASDQVDNCRELRSTTRSLTKLISPIPDNHHEEVWNSGRPKRACISKKRLSADERLTSNCKTYYKVEVITPKLRANSTKSQEVTKRQQSQSPKREEEKDKGLIVKFKKLRTSELIQLNNEATNFLFPKKDDTSDEEDDDDEANTTASSVDSCNVEIEEYNSTAQKVKSEDEEASRDSTGKKKKRRTHAEAFILDNQKYYKFETPGSRLRYQGSYLPMVLASPERPVKTEDDITIDEPPEKKAKYASNSKFKLDAYKFSFEKVPANMGWYKAFKRLDNAEQSYPFFSNYMWESLLLPYQMRSIPPLDHKACLNTYQELVKCIAENVAAKAELESRSSSPEPSISSSSSVYDPDEDSKLSASTSSSICSDDKTFKAGNSRTRKSNRIIVNSASSGKNPRKSPRQHASTLAILSDLIHQRRRRSRTKPVEDQNQSKPEEEINQSLATIPEEEILPPQPEEQEVVAPPPPIEPETPVQSASCPEIPKDSPNSTKKTNGRKVKPKIDYYSIVKQIEDEMDTAFGEDEDQYELEFDDSGVYFSNSKTTLEDIMGLYDENNSKETNKSCRRFFNCTPGKKPGIKKRKLNRTGWPNKSRRSVKKESNKEKEDDNSSTVGSASVNNSEEENGGDQQEDAEEGPAKEQKSEIVKRQNKNRKVLCKKNHIKQSRSSERNCDVGKNRVQILSNKLINGDLPQPYVCVQKLDSKKLAKTLLSSPKRTNKRQRRIPGSPKSPRMLRKPRGRWYRER